VNPSSEERQTLESMARKYTSSYCDVIRAKIILLANEVACEHPYTLGLPLSRLSVEEIRQHVISQCLIAEISGATLWRWLSSDAFAPGNIEAGSFLAIRTLPQKPDTSSIFTNVSGRALHWLPMITSSAQTKTPVFKPAAENNRRCR
jgi:hypothetical protein